MTAFTASNGSVNNFDAYSGGSVNATLDTYAISNQSTLVVRSDTYACANHSVAFGSLDTVTFSGTGGELRFDPTFVRVIPFTGGSGNSPAYGAAISQGGVSGVFLGAWASWQSDPVAAAAAMPASGFIKIGGVTGGSFSAGALTGITATCSGADVQGWIEVRGPDAATITVPRIGKVTSVEAWFELGTTNGTRGQILPCPTTATAASVWAGVWIETSAGSGVYEQFPGVGSMVALSTTPTDARAKFVWQTTAGIRIGNDGTNAVGFLPPTGCKVRIPAVILTNCTRTVSGSGARVLPNATIATRQEMITTGAGYFDMRGAAIQWYMNLSQAFYAKYKSCTLNDSMILSEIASPLDVDDCIVAPTQAQLNFALNASSCFAGGTIKNSKLVRFSLAASGAYVASVNYVTGVTFDNVTTLTLTLRANGTTGAYTSTQAVSCTWLNCTNIGGRMVLVGAQSCTVSGLKYADSFIATTATNPFYAIEFSTGSANNTVVGGSTMTGIVNTHPYNGWVSVNACYNTVVKEIGTFGAPFNCGSANAMGVGLNAAGNNDGIKFKRCYFTLTRTGPYAFVNSDTNVLVENVAGDYADTMVLASLNTVAKGCGLTGATTGQVSVYGTHWLDRFTSATAGVVELLMNEPTSASAAQSVVSAGTPQFNSSGSVLMTKVGDQIIWEMPYFSLGHTALANSAPVVTGTNVTYSSGARWGNHDIEFQIDQGTGYGGTWLALTAANLSAQVITASTGFKLKIRVTTATASATNAITNIRVVTVTTSTAQSTNLYPISTNSLTFTGLPNGCDVVVLQAGTTTILASADQIVGTSYTYTYSGAQSVDVGFIKPGFVPFYIRGLALTTADSNIPVAMTADRNYF